MALLINPKSTKLFKIKLGPQATKKKKKSLLPAHQIIGEANEQNDSGIFLPLILNNIRKVW